VYWSELKTAGTQFGHRPRAINGTNNNMLASGGAGSGSGTGGLGAAPPNMHHSTGMRFSGGGIQDHFAYPASSSSRGGGMALGALEGEFPKPGRRGQVGVFVREATLANQGAYAPPAAGMPTPL
jgi:hypothetical protein